MWNPPISQDPVCKTQCFFQWSFEYLDTSIGTQDGLGLCGFIPLCNASRAISSSSDSTQIITSSAKSWLVSKIGNRCSTTLHNVYSMSLLKGDGQGLIPASLLKNQERNFHSILALYRTFSSGVRTCHQRCDLTRRFMKLQKISGYRLVSIMLGILRTLIIYYYCGPSSFFSFSR